MENEPVQRRIKRDTKVERASSFRTSLLLQKKKLQEQSQITNTFDKLKIESSLNKSTQENKNLPFGPTRLRKRSSKILKEKPVLNTEEPVKIEIVEEKIEDIKEATIEKAPPVNVEIALPSEETPAENKEDLNNNTQISNTEPSPVLQVPLIRTKSIHRTSSFKLTSNRLRKRRPETQPTETPTPSVVESEQLIPAATPASLSKDEETLGKEVKFLVKKSRLGRSGWKIMPEDEMLNLKLNSDILNRVLLIIR